MLKQSHAPEERYTNKRHARTFLEHTLLDLLALSKIDEGLDERETAHDILTQRSKLFSRLSLQKPAVKGTAT
jgi:hypothetical protein